MTSNDSGLRLVASVIAVLSAIPLVMMGVVMPLLWIAGSGRAPFSFGGWMMLLPAVPLLVFASAAYVLYGGVGVENEQRTDEGLEELRSAYARGELSDAEFETRRARLRSMEDTDFRSEVSSDE